MHLLFLTVVNLLNTYTFWAMWKGFYLNGDLSVFMKMSVLHALVILLSFIFYFIRNSKYAQKLISFNQLPAGTNKIKVAYIGALVGAYGLGIVNFVVILVLLTINGTIDIWTSSNAT